MTRRLRSLDTGPTRNRRCGGVERSEALKRPGILKETAVIPAERWETLHSTPEITPGVRNLLAAELTDVHEYWGAARDRIPASATSDLALRSQLIRCPATSA